MTEHTQVGIVGAGPAGLLLSQVLHLQGVDSIVVERRSPEHVLSRVRAGALEPGMVRFLREAGVGDRLDREGHPHTGFEISFDGTRFRVDLEELTGGEYITIYGQTNITEDLMAARAALGGQLVYEVENTRIEDLDAERPAIRYRKDGSEHEIRCDFVAGCDGFHGVSRPTLPGDVLKSHDRKYPYHWIALLCESRPVDKELVYVHHPKGFVLCSMRSPTLSRYGIQCETGDSEDDWPEDRIWQTISDRLPPDLAETLDTGPCLDRNIVPMRSFVAEPMRFERLYLAGDSAHIVPPTGAKGLNLAGSDVYYLSRAFVEYYKGGRSDLLEAYGPTALDRVWKTEWFSGWMTQTLHTDPTHGPFDRQAQIAELRLLSQSRARQTALAQSYVGLPY